MTAFTEGMTPAQFVAALNTNFTEYWGTGGVATILASDGYIASINTNFGETTVAFGNSGTAFQTGLNKFNTFIHTLEYSGDQSDIDLTKFDITNLDPTTDVTFRQSVNITHKVTGVITNEKENGIAMYSKPSGVRVGMYRNQIRSKDSIIHGVVSFSLANLFRVNNWVRIGLSDATNQNRIELSAYGANALKFSIWEAGVEVYTTASGVINFGQFQFVISPLNISAWLLTNDAWVQIGTTQTYSLGTLKFYASSEGAIAGKTSIRDIYITSRKFTTILPGIANTARIYGEVPDGTTDNSIALNAALVLGNIVLENGIFAISDSLKIPSGRTITGKNAKVFKLANSLDNSFRNTDFTNGNTYINIIGNGNFVFDGNAANNDDGYETYSDLLREDVWDYSKITTETYRYLNQLFIRVSNLVIQNVDFINYPHWSCLVQNCSNVLIKNCFYQYGPLLVPANTDVVNINWGGHNIDIMNLWTCTDDDTFTIGSFRPDYKVVKQGNDNVGDFSNINIQDITVITTSGRVLLFLISEGNKCNGVHVSNILCNSSYSPFMIGYPDYTLVDPVQDDIKNIYFDNIEVDVAVVDAIFKVRQPCKDIAVTNLTNNTDKGNISFEAGLVAADIENFTIEGVLQEP
jgi:hypothetical protein